MAALRYCCSTAVDRTTATHATQAFFIRNLFPPVFGSSSTVRNMTNVPTPPGLITKPADQVPPYAPHVYMSLRSPKIINYPHYYISSYTYIYTFIHTYIYLYIYWHLDRGFECLRKVTTFFGPSLYFAFRSEYVRVFWAI